MHDPLPAAGELWTEARRPGAWPDAKQSAPPSKAEGTSFQRLLDDTRRCLSHRYLLESSLKLTDIAARVGCSEFSSFAAGCLTSTLRPEQRLRVAKDLPVIESKLVLPPVGDPLRAGGIGA